MFLGLLPRICHFIPLASKCQCRKSSLRVNCLLTVMLNAAPFTLLNLVRSTNPFFMCSEKGIHPDVNVHAM